MSQNIVIEFTADTKQVTLAAEAVEKLAGVDKELSSTFQKTNNDLKQQKDLYASLTSGLGAFVDKLNNAQKTATATFGTKAITDFNKNLVQSTDVVKLLAVSLGAAKDKLATLGSGTPEFIKLNGEIQRGTELLKQYALSVQDVEVKSTSATGGISKLYGFFRTAANIIPGLGISGIFLYISEGISALISDLFKGKEAVKQFTDEEIAARQKVASSMGDEIGKVTLLKAALESEKESRQNKKKALDELIELQPKYFGQLKLEGDTVAGLGTAYDAYTSSILKTAKAKAALSELQEFYKKRLDLELQATEDLTVVEKKFQDFQKLQVDAFNKGKIAPVQNFSKQDNANIGLLANISEIDRQIQGVIKTITDSDIDIDTLIDGKDHKAKQRATKSISDVVAELRKELATISNEEIINQITPKEADIDRMKAYEKAFKGLFDLGSTANTPIVKKLNVELDPINVRVLEAQVNDLVQKLSKPDTIKAPEIIDNLKQQSAAVIADINSIYSKITDSNSRELDKELIHLQDNYEKGILSTEDYQKKLQAIKRRYQIFDDDNNVTRLETILASDKLSEKDREDLEKKLYDARKKRLDDNLVDETKAAEKKRQLAQKSIQERLAIETLGADALKGAGDVYFENLAASYQNDMQLNQELLNNKQITQDEFNKRQKQLQKQQAAVNKEKAIFDVIIDGAKALFQIEAQAAIMNAVIPGSGAIALAQIPYLLGAEAIQLGIIAARKFKTGVISLDGPGNGTSDSIPAWLSKGESVMTARETDKYQPYLQAMRDDKFEIMLAKLAPSQPFDMPRMAVPAFDLPTMGTLPKWAMNQTTGHSIDYERLSDMIGKKVAKHVGNLGDIPGIDVQINENGISIIAKKGLDRIKYLNSRYKI